MPRPKTACPACGKLTGNVKMHAPYCSAQSGNASVAVAERPLVDTSSDPPLRSRRGRARYEMNVERPIDQIRIPPGVNTSAGTRTIEAKGAWCYFLRPDGATIRDALILSPNGGIPNHPDPQMRARYGMNFEYYRERGRRKGYEPVGSTLTADAIKRLVEILAENRDDEILFCEDEVVGCQAVIESADRPDIRDQARKRRRQFERRLETLRQPLDATALIGELNDIARAQTLAALDPNILAVMRSMIGEVNERVESMIGHFRSGGGEQASETAFDRTGKDSLSL